MKNHKKQTYDRGIFAERAAMIYLWLKGYKILETRYKTSVGEIDLIACKGNIVAFIEVKARATKDQALGSVTPRMRQRINRTAQHYLSHNEFKKNMVNKECRFDLITVSKPFFIHHLDNAWQLTA